MSEPQDPPSTAPRRHRGVAAESDGFTVEDAGTGISEIGRTEVTEIAGVPTVVRRRVSSGFTAEPVGGRPVSDGYTPRQRNSVSGGFGPETSDGASYSVDSRGPGYTGPGKSGAPPTQEIQAAVDMLLLNLDHKFVTPEPLNVALTHPSWRNERPQVTIDNQRLEFLGDLVLGLAMGDILLLKLPNSQEGELSVLKSHLVRESTLATLAERLGVGPALRLGRGEEQNGGRQRPAILADAMEAILAAVFIDAGYDHARALVERLFAEPLAELLASTREAAATTTTALHAKTRNYKTALQEWLARAHGEAPEYQVLCELGPADARRFRVQVETRLHGTIHRARGEAPTVKAAENAAAERLFHTLTEAE